MVSPDKASEDDWTWRSACHHQLSTWELRGRLHRRDEMKELLEIIHRVYNFGLNLIYKSKTDKNEDS